MTLIYLTLKQFGDEIIKFDLENDFNLPNSQTNYRLMLNNYT